MSDTDMSDARRAPTAPSPRRPGLVWWQAAVVGSLVVAVLNVLILLIGRAAGASFDYVESGVSYSVAVTDVVLASVPALVLAVVVSALVSRWWQGIFRLTQIVAAALALLTVAGPLMTDTDTGSQIALALMHVVLGAVCVVSLEAVRRRARANPVI